MQDVVADLGAPLDPLFLALELGLFFLAFLQFYVVEAGFEDAEGILAVVLLGAGFRVLDHDAGGDVAHTDAGLDLVDVLAAVAAGAEGVPLEVAGVDLDIDAVVDERIDKDRREGRLALSLGVERGDTHESMDAVLGLEVAVGVVALHLDGAGLDAGLFPFQKGRNIRLESIALRPAEIHAHQHCRPVVGLRAAGARVDGQHGTEVVALVSEHILQLKGLHGALRRMEGCFQLPGLVRFDGFGVVRPGNAFLGELVEHVEVVGEGGGLVVVADPGLEAGEFFEEGFGCLGVAPEIRREGLLLTGGHIAPFSGDVKALLEDRKPSPEVFDLFGCNHYPQ